MPEPLGEVLSWGQTGHLGRARNHNSMLLCFIRKPHCTKKILGPLNWGQNRTPRRCPGTAVANASAAPAPDPGDRRSSYALACRLDVRARLEG